MSLIVRAAEIADAQELCDILNEIIHIGGSTALEDSLNIESFSNYFLSSLDHICCFVAEDENGKLWGFQSLVKRKNLPVACADIATFARTQPKKRGVGSSLFRETCKFASAHKFDSLNATIRADNVSGLSYYAKMGFKDHSVTKDVPLKDGSIVDRISKRLFI